MTPSSAVPEMSRPVAIGQVGQHGLDRDVAATADECLAIAARLRIPAVGALACRFRVSPLGRGVILAQGTLTARVTQECIVTTDSFEVEVQEDFRLRFVPEDQFVEPDEDDMLDLEADDELPYAGHHIDLGEAAVEQLALALDPYPRKPDAELPPEATESEVPASVSPFAALARRGGSG